MATWAHYDARTICPGILSSFAYPQQCKRIATARLHGCLRHVPIVEFDVLATLFRCTLPRGKPNSDATSDTALSRLASVSSTGHRIHPNFHPEFRISVVRVHKLIPVQSSSDKIAHSVEVAIPNKWLHGSSNGIFSSDVTGLAYSCYQPWRGSGCRSYPNMAPIARTIRRAPPCGAIN